MMRKVIVGVSALALVIAAARAGAAQRIKAGVLNCDMSAGIGLHHRIAKAVSCMFTPGSPGPAGKL